MMIKHLARISRGKGNVGDGGGEFGVGGGFVLQK
jgi:hypothetical protein